MRTIRVLLVLGFVAALGSGCATRYFLKLPTPEEFTKPLPQLKQEYPDLTRPESKTVFSMPKAWQLTDAWSKPHSRGFCKWMLFPPMWIYNPSFYWYWEFEGKKISALIDHPLILGYRAHVWKLKVDDRKK